MRLVVPLVVALLAGCQHRTEYLGARVPSACTVRDVEGCLGWMAERDLAAAELDLYEDAALRAYVQGVADRLARGSLLAAAPRVVIADRDDTYAISGRRIVVGRTTIEKLATEAELAGVIAHELAHVEARHGVVSLFGRPPADNLAARRDAEAIADERAVWLLERAGYAPVAMGRALRAVLEAEDEEHPARADRIARVEALAGGRGGVEARGELLRRLDHMVVGRDPRLGHRTTGDHDAWVVAALGVALDLEDGDAVRSADEVLAVRRGDAAVVAYAIGRPWAREIAAKLEDRAVTATALGRLVSGVVPSGARAALAPLDKLADSVRATLPQPSPGTRVAILERPRGAVVLELAGTAEPPFSVCRRPPAAASASRPRHALRGGSGVPLGECPEGFGLRAATPDELVDAAPRRIVLEPAPSSGRIGRLGICRGRLLDDPALRVAAGDPVKCADRAAPSDRS
ncbi:MAG: M48 family metalloprotease [Deltaproteobacteria bacterium]|nr:M48 family metalloprotease [Deltaproteobacteria bacterium]